ncbi:MAG TPA: sigma-70 family RNA polymerase sigma factor [Sunxiuqinia sp.]|nr:sigma-70 family RNA polymerase sigma factor [Sunxiuqinia sp.]
MEHASNTIERLRNGEKAVFKQIYHSYYRLLYNLGMQYLEDENETREIVQNVYLKLWEVWEGLNDQSNIRNFLFTLVKNNCLNHLKRRQLVLAHNEKIRQRELDYQYELLQRLSFDYMEFKAE